MSIISSNLSSFETIPSEVRQMILHRLDIKNLSKLKCASNRNLIKDIEKTAHRHRLADGAIHPSYFFEHHKALNKDYNSLTLNYPLDSTLGLLQDIFLEDLKILNGKKITFINLPQTLKRLSIIGVSSFQENHFPLLPTSLRVLQVWFNSPINSLNGLPESLQILDFRFIQNLKSFDSFPPDLKELRLDSLMNIKDEDIKKLPRTLTALHLTSATSLTDQSAENFPEKLEFLNIAKNKLFTNQGLRKLPKNLKTLFISLNKQVKISTNLRNSLFAIQLVHTAKGVYFFSQNIFERYKCCVYKQEDVLYYLDKEHLLEKYTSQPVGCLRKLKANFTFDQVEPTITLSYYAQPKNIKTLKFAGDGQFLDIEIVKGKLNQGIEKCGTEILEGHFINDIMISGKAYTRAVIEYINKNFEFSYDRQNGISSLFYKEWSLSFSKKQKVIYDKLKGKTIKKNISFFSLFSEPYFIYKIHDPKKENLYVYITPYSIYFGPLINNLPHGSGWEFIKGNIYEGEFVAGSKQGKGTLWTERGDVYEGDFLNNQFHGQGTCSFYNLDRYTGQFEHGLQHGYGTLINQEFIYTGRFKEGNFFGKGEMKLNNGFIKKYNFIETDFCIVEYPDGSIYKGEILPFSLLRHGQGLMLYKANSLEEQDSIVEVEFDKDILISVKRMDLEVFLEDK